MAVSGLQIWDVLSSPTPHRTDQPSVARHNSVCAIGTWLSVS